MTERPSPEAVEHAIEVVNLVAPGPRAGGPDCTLESLALDPLHRVEIALEIEDRWQVELSDDEAAEWTTIGCIARTIDAASRKAAA